MSCRQIRRVWLIGIGFGFGEDYIQDHRLHAADANLINYFGELGARPGPVPHGQDAIVIDVDVNKLRRRPRRVVLTSPCAKVVEKSFRRRQQSRKIEERHQQCQSDPQDAGVNKKPPLRTRHGVCPSPHQLQPGAQARVHDERTLLHRCASVHHRWLIFFCLICFNLR